MINYKGWFALILLSTTPIYGQIPGLKFEKIVIKTDTSSFNSDDHVIWFNGDPHLYFQYYREDEICEVDIYPEEYMPAGRLQLNRSANFELLDSIVFLNDFLRFRVQFNDLTKTSFLNFTFVLPSEDSSENIQIVRLLPYTSTKVELYTEDKDLFIGEEKVFDLVTDHVENIRIKNFWSTGKDVNYRIARDNNQLKLHVLSEKLGTQTLELQLSTLKPFISPDGNIEYNLPLITKEFNVKASRLRFLKADKEEIMLDQTNLEGYELQIDNSSFFDLQKTYRIENQEAPGGYLVAELFTKNYLSNGRILCSLRSYSLHRKSDGYLYIKDGDIAKFITNLDIIPKTNISKISILREGQDWTDNLIIYPGETIDIRIEGSSLHRSNFVFEDLYDVTVDTLIRNENITNYKLKIPIDVDRKKITIYNNGERTGFELTVREYQLPREFDFIKINLGNLSSTFSIMNNTVLYGDVIQDVILSFDRNKIDSEGKLYGKQYLDISITLRGNGNELIETKKITGITICPGEYSQRFSNYTGNDCTTGNLFLNSYLSKKTFDLDEWSKIELEISHDKSKHGGSGLSKSVEIYLQRSWKFDIEVSFPAGLLIFEKKKETETTTSGNLTGISMAMFAQFSFYQKNKINRYKPYKIGAGFIALDAFNFSNNADSRDVALVILGSLYPTTKDTKLTFPLYFGFGYKFQQENLFFLVGPGIRVRF